MRKIYFLMALLLLVSTAALAQRDQRETDFPGSKDPGFISRFPGSVIEYYQFSKFDRYKLPISKVEYFESEDKTTFHDIIDLSGAVTRIQYSIPKDNNPYFVFKNYEAALIKGNYQILFSGSGSEELGLATFSWYWAYFGGEECINPLHGESVDPDGENYCYIASKLTQGEEETYLAIYIVNKPGDWNFTLATIDIIEITTPGVGLIDVNPEYMKKMLEQQGHIALYGIYFDTGKSDIKPESEASLKNIAELLKQNQDINLYVVGHTDNTGDFDVNMTLSKDRATSVVDYLTTEISIDPNRLKAFGVGCLSPVSTNNSEKGRAQNRRVELIIQ